MVLFRPMVSWETAGQTKVKANAKAMADEKDRK
jgi:hypothetical protein